MRYLTELLKRPQLGIWDSPVAFSHDGTRTFTLREILDLNPPITPSNALNIEQWRQLILAQLTLGHERESSGPTIVKYQFASPIGFAHGSQQAIDRIHKRTPLGDQIVTSKIEFLTALLDDCRRHSQP